MNGCASRFAEDRVKYEFLASITHSIRTHPLSGIIGMTELLLETSLTGDQREYVESARVCAEHLLETLSTTLDYSALAEGPVQLEDYEFSLVDAVKTAAEDYRTRARAKSLKFLVTVDSELPKVVVGDPRRLRRDRLAADIECGEVYRAQGPLRSGWRRRRKTGSG